MLAAVIKKHTSATNVWITGKLNMGISQAVSQNVVKFYASGEDQKDDFQNLIINITPRERHSHPLYPAATWPRRFIDDTDLHSSSDPETERDPHGHASGQGWKHRAR